MSADSFDPTAPTAAAPTAAANSGIDLDELDPSIRPQDDLFRHVHGKWMARTEIPADKARYGSFYVLAEAAEKAVQDIIVEAQTAERGTEERKFGDLYASFMAEERIEELGASPLMPLLASAASVSSIETLLETLGQLERHGTSGFAQMFVDNDPGSPERYLVFLEQGGLGLPDESYYREGKSADIREKYVAYLTTMFGLAQLTDAAARATRVFELETLIAAAHWDNVKSRDSQAAYNLMSWADVLELAPGLDGWAAAIDAPAGVFDEVVIRQPSFVSGVAALLVDERIDSWRDWLSWQVIRSNAGYLSRAFVEANFDFYGRTLTGTPEMRARWKRGVSLVEGSLGEAVGRTYIARHFSPTAKAKMDILVGHLIEAYRESITNLAWMTDATRQRALEKLDKFTPKIGFPAKWRDYSALEVDAVDLIGNVRATAEFEFRRELGKIGKPLDRDEWFMTPQTINAYYNPGFNEIVFPAAILQYPFFDENRDDAANFGAIGAVIGHEIGHGFDDQGSRFDGDGLLTDWWTADDRAAFEQLTASLIAQYDALAPVQVPEQHVNGALTIGENIGDLGGLGIAWKAYLLSLGAGASTGSATVGSAAGGASTGSATVGASTGSATVGSAAGGASTGSATVGASTGSATVGASTGSAAVGSAAGGPPIVEGLTGAERFFLSWAQAWQLKARDEEVIRLISIDPHSPNEFRCNQIVRNIDEFYETFGVTESDALWLDPTERVTIW